MRSQLSAVSIVRLKDQQTINIDFKNQQKIGQGSFGSAYLVSDPLSRGFMVCKVVDLKGKSKNFSLPHHHLVRLAYKEISYLQKQDLLIGYKHDGVRHKMYILMKYLKGKPEWNINKIQHPQIEYLCFRALRKLHRNSIAHNDPHQANFIIYNYKKAQMIDFGLAKDHNLFREWRDYHKFLKKRSGAENPLSLVPDLTLNVLIHFYCQEMIEHIQENKLDTAKQIFCYSVVIISALCGVSLLGAASLIAQELIKAILYQTLNDFLATLEDTTEIWALNQVRSSTTRRYSQMLTNLFIVLQGFLLVFNLSLVYQHSVNFCFSLFDNNIVELLSTVICLKPLLHQIQYWQDFFEKYVQSTRDLSDAYDEKLGQNTPVYVPQFSHRPLSRTSSCSQLPPNLGIALK